MNLRVFYLYKTVGFGWLHWLRGGGCNTLVLMSLCVAVHKRFNEI